MLETVLMVAALAATFYLGQAIGYGHGWDAHRDRERGERRG